MSWFKKPKPLMLKYTTLSTSCTCWQTTSSLKMYVIDPCKMIKFSSTCCRFQRVYDDDSARDQEEDGAAQEEKAPESRDLVPKFTEAISLGVQALSLFGVLEETDEDITLEPVPLVTW